MTKACTLELAKSCTSVGAHPADTRAPIPPNASSRGWGIPHTEQHYWGVGDYDLQVAITEALCRMTSEKQRGELASQWFSMEFVTNAFKGIKDSEFETDCRKFLNQVNAMLGDKRRVFTYPCLSAFLGEYELQIPEDDNLEEFWIDFNTGSRSISFYVAADDEAHQWETVSIPEEEVETYIVKEEKDKKTLTVNMKNPVCVGDEEGEKIILHFDSALEILDAVRKVYGANKCQNAGDKKGGNGKSQYHEDGYGPNFPPLHIPVKKGIKAFHKEEDLDTCEKQKLDELNDIVPDSQPMNRIDKPLLPGLENSTAENKSRKKQMCWVPEKIISHCNNQNMSAAETSNLSDRAAKQRAFSSIFKITSPKLRHKQGYNGEIVEQKQNETDKLPGKNGKTNSPESWNDFKHLEDGISKNSSSKIVPSKPQTLLNASRKTKSSVVPSALSIEANGEVDFDACPLRKDVANKKAEQRAKSKAVVETTDMLIHKLSDRYQRSECAKSTRKLYQSFSNSRASLSKSAFSFNKKNSQNKGSKNLKSETLLNITTGHLMDDVYNFNLNGFDEPTIKLGIQEFHVTKFKATTSLSQKINHEDERKARTQKKQDRKVMRKLQRKNLLKNMFQ
ncbi:synaptonemal complex protein 2-like [Sphaerodactylus townsendi]|uniref:synaptonemal complex protein 2-like n=1 Tax=Sphaerodactylus townsendi TaxID=933632 RepID=UPI002025B7DF|nr:synaptonemal complex protein 2-like [Sphaerodactylus townsendi]